ncbi:hypothetical protein H0H87_011425, partial [Tephrocybe sp. NHM501043]
RDSSSPTYWKAVVDLGHACDAHQISWVLLGGTACASLGGPRTTQDINIVAHSATAPGTEIATLQKALPGCLISKTDQYRCPKVTMDGIEVDIFDPVVWPEHNYMKFLSNPYLVHAPGMTSQIKVPHPSELLAEKIKMAADRANSKKGPNDKIDVAFLTECVQEMS